MGKSKKILPIATAKRDQCLYLKCALPKSTAPAGCGAGKRQPPTSVIGASYNVLILPQEGNMQTIIKKVSRKGYDAALQMRANVDTARMQALAKAGRRRKQEGATMVEYAILVALIAVAVIATVVILGERIDEVFERVVEELKGVTD